MYQVAGRAPPIRCNCVRFLPTVLQVGLSSPDAYINSRAVEEDREVGEC
jgi:hypothetical protein